MQLDDITPKTLDAYLHTFEKDIAQPSPFLELHCFHCPPQASLSEKNYLFFDWLEARVRENLRHQRQEHAEQYNNLGWREALQHDFRQSNDLLEAWSALFYRYFAHESRSFDDLAKSSGSETRQFRRRLDSGLQELCALIQRAEMDAHRSQQRASLGASIPEADYQHLYGTQASVARICAWLGAPDGPAIISLEGLGGIGKTSLAQAVSEQLLSGEQTQFRDILWVSARQELLTPRGEIEKLNPSAHTLDDIVTGLAQVLGLGHLAGLNTIEKQDGLKTVLGLQAYLVIIDNLETLQEVRALLPLLRKVSGASRFILTSRKSLAAFPQVQVFSLPELSRADSCKLVESEVSRRRPGYKLPAESADKILDVVGGLPLALKLVAAQISEFSEKYVLDGLGALTPGKSQTALYTYIYKNIWSQLDDTSRQLLLSMLMIPQNGDTLDWIRTQSGLTNGEFESAFSRLMDFSLLETHSIQGGGRYSLHRLTQSFLKSNVLSGWARA